MRFVELKSSEQLDMQSLHRVRDRLIGERTALLNQLRAVLMEDMRVEWRELDRRIEAFDDEFAGLAKTDEAARRLVSIPGIGVLNATALVAAIGNGATFARGGDTAGSTAGASANDDGM